MSRLLVAVLSFLAACHELPRATGPGSKAALGQWIWTRADLALFAESAAQRPGLEAGVFVGSIRCDQRSGRLVAQAGLSPALPNTDVVTVVIRLADGLDRCRTVSDSTHAFDHSLDSAVTVLRSRGRSAPVHTVQLDYDAPQRALAAWASTVRFLAGHSLASDSVWVTSIIAHLREPAYGDLFRDVVRGHVLQVFDTGEAASATQVDEAVRLASRAGLPFRLGLGAFERQTRDGMTEHRAWFGTVPRFAAIEGYRGLWIFPAGHRWTSFLTEL